MKELILIRHAKSDWGNEHLKDIDRHLGERGYNDAYYLSNWYLENRNMPDLVLSSTATRALNTALIFARALALDMKNFKLEKGIYEGTTSTLFDIIKHLPDSKKSVMLFGHNPGITNISNLLSGDIFFDNVPTCGMVFLKFETGFWKDLEPKGGKLDVFRFPKDFKNRI